MSNPTLLDDFHSGSFGSPRRRQRAPHYKRRPYRHKHLSVKVKRARFRSRVQANPFLGAGMKTGQILMEDGELSNRWYPYGSPRNDSISYPYKSAESCMDEVHAGPPWTTGGPFRKVEIGPVVPFTMLGNSVYTSDVFMNQGPYHGRVRYVGGFSPPDPFPGSSEGIFDLKTSLGKNSPLVPVLSTLESQVWSRTKPKIETGALFVAMAEAKDASHMLHTSARGFVDIYRKLGGDMSSKVLAPKKVADHFLNHNFGWVPFVNDVVAFCDNVVNSDDRIRRISANNGQDVRRRVTLLNHTERTNLGGDAICLVSPGNIFQIQSMFTSTPRFEVWLERTVHAHSVGRFRYYIPYFDPSNPEASGMLGALRRQLAIHGARASPANIYKSIKWTWLIDWVTNTGRTVSALSDQLIDNMAATYLFLCHTEELKYVFRQFMPFNGTSGGPRTLEWQRIIAVTQRKECDAPFGFGLSWEELSPKQLALLASIGISRH
jgi:hypothetical protein